MGLVFPLRASAEEQGLGLDVAMHGEDAYVHAGGMDTSVARQESGGMAPALASTPLAAN